MPSARKPPVSDLSALLKKLNEATECRDEALIAVSEGTILQC